MDFEQAKQSILCAMEENIERKDGSRLSAEDRLKLHDSLDEHEDCFNEYEDDASEFLDTFNLIEDNDSICIECECCGELISVE